MYIHNQMVRKNGGDMINFIFQQVRLKKSEKKNNFSTKIEQQQKSKAQTVEIYHIIY